MDTTSWLLSPEQEANRKKYVEERYQLHSNESSEQLSIAVWAELASYGLLLVEANKVLIASNSKGANDSSITKAIALINNRERHTDTKYAANFKHVKEALKDALTLVEANLMLVARTDVLAVISDKVRKFETFETKIDELHFGHAERVGAIIRWQSEVKREIHNAEIKNFKDFVSQSEVKLLEDLGNVK